jgi:hypothetical protein
MQRAPRVGCEGLASTRDERTPRKRRCGPPGSDGPRIVLLERAGRKCDRSLYKLLGIVAPASSRKQ